MENYSGQVLALPPGKTFFFLRVLESALHFLAENEIKSTEIVHSSIGIE